MSAKKKKHIEWTVHQSWILITSVRYFHRLRWCKRTISKKYLRSVQYKCLRESFCQTLQDQTLNQAMGVERLLRVKGVIHAVCTGNEVSIQHQNINKSTVINYIHMQFCKQIPISRYRAAETGLVNRYGLPDDSPVSKSAEVTAVLAGDKGETDD